MREEIRKILAQYADEKYKEFSAGLIPGAKPHMGVRLPQLRQIAKSIVNDNEYKAGIELVLKQYQDVLGSLGVKKIETVGQTFDPEIHEAVSSVQDEKYGEKEITQEFRTGYMIGTKVIRHAMVVVAN